MFSPCFTRIVQSVRAVAIVAAVAVFGPVFAGQLAAAPAIDGQSPVASSGTRVLDTNDYVQTELDWRSYYLNRQPGGTDGVLPDAFGTSGGVWLQSPGTDGS